MSTGILWAIFAAMLLAGPAIAYVAGRRSGGATARESQYESALERAARARVAREAIRSSTDDERRNRLRGWSGE